MFVEKNVDYLQFSKDLVPAWGWVDLGERSNMPFYQKKMKGRWGAVAHVGNPNTGKSLMVLSGKACRAVSEEWDIKELMRLAYIGGAKFSRVDWAVTQYIDEDGLLLPSRVAEVHREGKVSGAWAMSGCKSIRNESNGNVETVYVGDMKKRGKKGIFRAYDKGEEWGIGAGIVTRLEAEEKRENAHRSVARYVNGDADIASILMSRIGVDDEEWRAVMGAEAVDVSRGLGKDGKPDEEDHKTWAWLLRQVAPAMGKALAVDHVKGIGNGNLDMFMREMMSSYTRASSKLDSDDTMGL